MGFGFFFVCFLVLILIPPEKPLITSTSALKDFIKYLQTFYRFNRIQSSPLGLVLHVPHCREVRCLSIMFYDWFFLNPPCL